MSDDELVWEAHKWNIREYGNRNGSISRNVIVEQLIQKDKANNSRIAIYISILALSINIIIPLIKYLF